MWSMDDRLPYDVVTVRLALAVVNLPGTNATYNKAKIASAFVLIRHSRYSD